MKNNNYDITGNEAYSTFSQGKIELLSKWKFL